MSKAGRTRTMKGALLAAAVAFLGLVILPFAMSGNVSAAPTTLYSQLNDGAWRTAQGTNWLAQSFTTGATATSVTDVSIMFRNASENNGSSNGGTSYSLSIWSSVSGAPGTQLAAVATSVTPGGWSQGTPSYTLATPLTLAASTQYFVVLTGSAGGTMGWKCNSATPTSSVSPTPTFTTLSSSNSGSSWSSLTGTCAGNYFGMSVTGATMTTPVLGTFSNVNATYGDAAQTITAPTADTAGSFAYTSSNTAVATISGSTLTFAGAGTSTITANFTPTDTTNYTVASTTMTVTVAQATPVLGTFTNVNATFGDPAQTITAPTANTAGSFSYSSSDTSVATISGSTLTFAGTGTSTITANFTPTNAVNYTTASTTMTVTVAQATPVLGTFTNVNATYGDAAQTITAPTANTAGSFSYSSSDTSVATISGSTLTFAGTGTSTITANFTPTDTTNYTTASTTMTVTVAQAAPVLGTFSNVNATFGDAAQTITAPSADTAGSFSYSSSDTAVATISGSTLTFAGAGTSTITANFTPTDTTNYTVASTTMTVTVAQATPVLGTFTNVNATFGDPAQTITAPTSSVPGSFSYSSSDTAVATISGSTLTFAGAGTSTITANFTPTDTTNYTAASTTMTVTVAQATPVLGTFSNVNATYGDAAQTITAPSADTAGSFTYTSSDTAVATISGSTLTFAGAGAATITANFTPTDTTNYTVASTTMTVTVAQATPVLGTFTNVNATFGDPAQTITAPTSSVPGSFTYTSSNTAVATISGTTLTFAGAGTATITANFTPTDTTNYTTASTTTTVTVGQATPILGTFSNVNATFGDAAQTITAPTSSVPGSFTYTSSNTAVATISGSTLTFAGAGTATITANFTPTDTTNYTTASTTTTVTVGQATPPTTIAPTTPPSTTTTTTPSSVVPTPGFPEPTPYAPSDDIFGDTEGEQVAVTIDASIGDVAANAPIQIRAVALEPNARVVVTVYSEPQVVLTGTADSNGAFSATTYLPANLEPGRHTVLAETTAESGPIEVAGAFVIDDEGTINNLAQPAVLTGFVGPNDERLTRALDLNRPVWDVAARPLTTAAIAISAISLLGIAGAIGLSGAPSTVGGMGTATSDGGSGSNSGQRKRNARGKLSGVVTKKLKGIQIESTARGDLSSSWAMPGTTKTDEFSRSVPGVLGRYSAAAPRVFVDGAWLRAIFGSFGFLSWGIGLVLGIVAAFVDTNSPLTPIYPLLLAMIVLGILDAAAGAIAWITLIVIALVTGNITGWPDIRTALGLGILLATISLLAHVIRPLRRYCAENASEAWERFFDYVMMPVFVAFASGSALKALNGLSGLEIVSSSEVSTMRWVVGITVIARLGCEDIASHWYPERMIMVQPAKLVSPNRTKSGISIVIRSLVFLMIAEPFFGITATTVLAAVLLAIPVVMKLWEDDLPNSKWLNKWLPRGLFRFLCMLILGMYLTAVFIGKNGGDAAVKSSFIWLLLPGVVVGVVELFARFGGEWPNVTVRRSLGAVVWLTAASLVTGYLVLFV